MQGSLNIQPFWQTQENKSLDELLFIPDKVEVVDPAEVRGGVTDWESWTAVAWEDILGESNSEEQNQRLRVHSMVGTEELTWENENTADLEYLTRL